MEVGARVWVYHANAWHPALVHSFTSSSVQCTIDANDMAVVVDALPSAIFLANDDAASANLDDLTNLVHLHEPGILHALSLRFARHDIYTRTGAILIAVNPFQKLPALYSDATQAAYMAHGRRRTVEKLPPPAPHVFEVADRAYRAMLQSSEPHNILVSGESGAGKTETTKFLLTYVAALSSCGKNDDDGCIRRRVLDSNPILEAFGNAKTTRNNNSSRFGKFIRLGFDSTSGGLVGATVSTYLLERVRLISQAQGERNFHIFYELLRGASPADRAAWHLNQPLTSFHYLNQSGCMDRHDGVDDAAQYHRTMAAMDTIGLCVEDRFWVLQLVAAVLHLGNVKFMAKKGQEGSTIADASAATAALVADFLGLSPTELDKALCTREIIAGFEPVTVVVSADRAAHARDTLAKTIYARVFDYLVTRLNTAMRVDDVTVAHLGIVDIFGFEIFAANSLEQLCINFANEKLQQLFARFVLEMDQLEYAAEGLPWTFVQYPTNDACIGLFEGRPLGLFTLLDEQARLSKGSDRALAAKYYDAFHSHAHFDASNLAQAHGMFTVRHYAGDVEYRTKGFCTKNKDSVPHDALAALTTSAHEFIADLFDEWHPHDTPAHLTPTHSSSHSFTGSRSFPSPPSSGRSSLVGGARPSLRSSLSSATVLSSTVCLTFKMQLASLLATLETSEPHFIRCIKPNDANAPTQLDTPRVCEQLRCCGLVEITRVARLGFPVRMPHEIFLAMFYHVLPREEPADDPPSMLAALAACVNGSTTTQMHIGATKVFLTQDALDTLQAALGARRVACAIVLQSYVRLYRTRTAFLATRHAAIVVQAHTRRRQAMAALAVARTAVVRLQRLVRRRRA
ncbi:hypothetical protein As57867_004758, partial [Aphanomyces stellatus]